MGRVPVSQLSPCSIAHKEAALSPSLLPHCHQYHTLTTLVFIFYVHDGLYTLSSIANPASAPPLRLGAAVGTSDTLVFQHGGLAVSSNGLATSTVLNDLIKLVTSSTPFFCSLEAK